MNDIADLRGPFPAFPDPIYRYKSIRNQGE